MVDLEQIRIAQEQRLLPVLKAWDEANKHLEEAIELAKAREQEFHEMSEDIRHNLMAIDFVRELAAGTETRATTRYLPEEAARPKLIPGDSPRPETLPAGHNDYTPAFSGLMRHSSRPLFPSAQKTARY